MEHLSTSNIKHPLTAYEQFVNDQRALEQNRYNTMELVDANRALRDEWDHLDPQKKDLYKKTAEKERTKYMEEFTRFKQTEEYKLFPKPQMKRLKKLFRQLKKKNSGSATKHNSFQSATFNEHSIFTQFLPEMQ